MNLFAYDGDNYVALYARNARNKKEMREIVLNSGYLSRTDHVVFKNIHYTIEQVYNNKKGKRDVDQSRSKFAI